MSSAARGDHEIPGGHSRAHVLAVLRSTGRPMTVTEAAAALGVHESTARYHLAMLSSAGLVTRSLARTPSPGRPRVRYAAGVGSAAPGRPAAPEPAGERYEQLAGVLARQLAATTDPAAAAREAGRRWTVALEAGRPAAGSPETALSIVADLMAKLGFRPERPLGAGEIVLRACPFEAVARQQRAVVCGVHLGMLERTFEDVGGAGSVDLQPFVTDRPLRCIASLRPGGAAGSNKAGGRAPAAGAGLPDG